MILNLDCRHGLAMLPDNSVDAIVCDPPYGIRMMGAKWDYDVPGVDIWVECLRVLKPGGHLLAFAGTRTQHRMAVRIEDAGFEIRDMIAWVYGSGFPKSTDVSKQIDSRGGKSVAWFGPWFRKWREDRGITQKQIAALFLSKSGRLTGCVANWELGLNMPTPDQFNLIRDTFGLPFESIDKAEREILSRVTKARSTSGASALPTMGGETLYQSWDITSPATDSARQWQGWGTALKPALEPITVARKPLEKKTVAENVLAYGAGVINIDACRVEGRERTEYGLSNATRTAGNTYGTPSPGANFDSTVGRYPANLIHDGSDEVVAMFPDSAGSGGSVPNVKISGYGDGAVGTGSAEYLGGERTKVDCGTGSAARFFYCAKASKKDRNEGLDHLPSVTRQTVATSGLSKHSDGSARNMAPEGKNPHPTVKPTELMRYLCRLVTPPGGLIVDPFAGSGSTGKAAILEGFQFVGFELDPQYSAIANARLEAARNAAG